MLVALQVIMKLLSIWKLSLVTGDLQSFLGCLVMFWVLVRRRELKVWGLSIGVAVYCERRFFPLISFSVVWVVLLHVLAMCGDGMSVCASGGCLSS
jgi:hypothetical protein